MGIVKFTTRYTCEWSKSIIKTRIFIQFTDVKIQRKVIEFDFISATAGNVERKIKKPTAKNRDTYDFYINCCIDNFWASFS